MKFRKIIVWLIIAIILLFGGKYIIKRYIYPYKYSEIVNEFSYKYNLDPFLVLAVIKTESNFNKEAESNKGAKGLMQIMDSTGEWIASKVGVDDFNPNMLYEAEVNVEFGCWYLNNLLNEFDDLSLALAAYNGGSGNVTKWLNDPEYSNDGESLTYIPFKETKKYVDRVSTRYNIYKFLYE
ncbi:lytic transglycosylase domain-containing protein [Clostridioides difficile]